MITRIFKAKSDKPFGYAKMYNYALKDLNHDINAIGLLIYLLSLPDDWVLHKTELYKKLKQGRTVIDKAFKVLTEKGYIIGARVLDSKGIIRSYEWTVHAVPFGDYNRMIENVQPDVKKPNVGKSTTGETTSTNKTLLTKETLTNNIKLHSVDSKEPNGNVSSDLSLNTNSVNATKPPAAAVEFTPEVIECARKILPMFPKNVWPTTKPQQNKWLDCVDKCHRIDKYDFKEIINICQWARNNDFWKSNFMSVLKLRKSKDGVKYIHMFAEKLKAHNERLQKDKAKPHQLPSVETKTGPNNADDWDNHGIMGAKPKH